MSISWLPDDRENTPEWRAGSQAGSQASHESALFGLMFYLKALASVFRFWVTPTPQQVWAIAPTKCLLHPPPPPPSLT